MDNKRLFSIILVVFIDLLGFSLILPLLPYYAETFNASEFVTGLLIASYAAMQLIGAPILGRLSDRFGRRPILLASVFGTFLGFILLGIANTLWILFASRIIDGITGGNISVAQAYISDVTDAKNRSKGLGMIGAAFGLGFIIGPAAGGFLSQWGYHVPALVAAGLSLINLGLIFFWLPESLTDERRAQQNSQKRPPVNLAALLTALKRPVQRIAAHHPLLLRAGLRHLPDYLLAVCAGQIQPDCRPDGLRANLRRCAVRDRTGFPGRSSHQSLPRRRAHHRQRGFDGGLTRRLGAGPIRAVAAHHPDPHRHLGRTLEHPALLHPDQGC